MLKKFWFNLLFLFLSLSHFLFSAVKTRFSYAFPKEFPYRMNHVSILHKIKLFVKAVYKLDPFYVRINCIVYRKLQFPINGSFKYYKNINLNSKLKLNCSYLKKKNYLIALVINPGCCPLNHFGNFLIMLIPGPL